MMFMSTRSAVGCEGFMHESSRACPEGMDLARDHFRPRRSSRYPWTMAKLFWRTGYYPFVASLISWVRRPKASCSRPGQRF